MLIYANLPFLFDTVDNRLEVFPLRAVLTVARFNGCVDLSDPPPDLAFA